MNTTSALLDLAICVAYVSIPLQLIFVATRKVTAIDFRKITGNMSSDELSFSRTLIIAFALFILCCGCGHGIRARKALSEISSSEFLDSMESMVHMATAGVSVFTSVLLGMWLPKLLSFCNDIEIHRKGYMKIVMEEYSNSKEEQIATSDHVEEIKGSERELRNKVAKLEGQLKRTAHELSIAQENNRQDWSVDLQVEETAGNLLQQTKHLSQELKPLPNLLGKCQGHKKVLSTRQLKQIIGAVYVLNKARPTWAENPDGTWGDFHLVLRRILGQKPTKAAERLPSENWLEVCDWCASLSHQQLISILQSVLNFANSPKPEKVVEIADQLEPMNTAA